MNQNFIWDFSFWNLKNMVTQLEVIARLELGYFFNVLRF